MPSDPVYNILLSSLSFFSTSSSSPFASTLNELGRYLQNKLSNDNDNDNSFTLFMEVAKRYQEAIEIFETNHDYVNATFILCNISRLFCYPFTSSVLVCHANTQNCDKNGNKQQQQSKIKWIKQVYEGLRWFNSHCDNILQSSCDQSLKEGVRFQ